MVWACFRSWARPLDPVKRTLNASEGVHSCSGNMSVSSQIIPLDIVPETLLVFYSRTTSSVFFHFLSNLPHITHLINMNLHMLFTTYTYTIQYTEFYFNLEITLIRIS